MSDNAKMVFADNLKSYLNAKGLTQLDLANYMGCSSSTVSDWCNGRKYPRVDKMQRMADWLGVRMSDLTSEHDKLDDADIAFYNRYKQLTEEEKKICATSSILWMLGGSAARKATDVQHFGILQLLPHTRCGHYPL